MPSGYQGRRGGPPKNDDGSSSSSIPKQFYDTIRRRIDDFKVGPHERLVFEAMDRAQRKAVHDIANRLRVISKSSGEGSNRHCVISRRPAATMQAASLCSESEPVSLTNDQKKVIVAFMKDHPISEEDIDAHITVSTEARECVRESRKFVAPRSEPQIPPSATSSPEVHRVRHELPAFHAKQKVLDSIEKNKVTLITGGTGCGKTTQVPQFLLERSTDLQKAVRIIVTQPRRLPAISVAQRVACERREPVGQTVGYHIRLEQKTSSSTVLTYCTSGVLLRMLTQDDLAKDCTHIILDEVHEREQNTDYLLIALKQALRKRHDLKVILMSATMEGNLEMFMGYFREFHIAHVDIPSRLYPVTNFHLADVMALTGYTPPESVYGGITTFSNGFGNGGFGGGFSGNNHSNSFSVGSWGCNGGGNDAFSATNWNNTDGKAPMSSHSYGKQPAFPSSNSASQHATAADSANGAVRAVQSAANLPSFGANKSSTHDGNSAMPYMTLAQQLVSASGNSAPNPLAASSHQQGGPSYAPAPAANSGMQRSSSVNTNYAAGQQLQFSQQQQQQTQYNSMQHAQQSNSGVYYGSQQLSWDSPTGYATASSDVVDLPMDDDDHSMTMQANQQQYYAGGGYNGQGGFGPRGGTPSNNMPHMQKPQQQTYQGSFGGGYAPQQQMYGAPHMQQSHYHSGTGAPGNGMYQYNQYQSQPNMQLNQQQQQQWPQQQVSQPPQHQPMFYVPDGGVGATNGYFAQPNSMQGSSTHASSYIHRSTSAAASLNDADQYGMGLREEENVRHSMTNHIQNIIPNRPISFCEQALDALSAARTILDRRAFTQFYRSMGGAQWDESVDVELAHVTVKYLIDSPIPGSILVFLPGYEDIQAVKEKIAYDRYDGLRPSICLLHSQLNSTDQQRVFEPTRQGERKVILSTNIAEASLTIDDVVFVVDCGKAKEKTYDHMSRISQLKCVWIAKSNAEQRRGRAGRCRPGFCFRLYSDEEFDKMLPSQVAEMKRSAIHDVCLHAKMFAPERMSVKEFLQLAPEPPETSAVDSSLKFLEQLGALYTEQEEEGSNMPMNGGSTYYGGRMKIKEPELTQLGRLVAHLPLDPQLARLLLFGYSLRCFSPIVTLVALLSHRDPFTLAIGDEKQAALSARDSFAHRDFSDHLMILRAFSAYAAIPSNMGQMQAKLCRDKYLSAPTLKMVNGIRRQLLMELRRIRFINEVDSALDDPYLNEYSNNWPMVQAAIVAGSYPCIGFVKGSKMRKIRTYTESHSQLHPSSSLKRQLLSPEKRQESLQKYYLGEPTIEYLAFQEFVKIDEGLTLRTATAIPSVTIFLFAGPIRLSREKLNSYFISTTEDVLEETEGGQDRDFFQPRDILELESWLSVKGCTGDFIRLMQLRFKLMDYVLAVLRTPLDINKEENKMLLSTLSDVLDIEHKTKGFNEVSDVYVRSGGNQNPLRKAGGYDFGANTSSSSHSYKDEKKLDSVHSSQPVRQQYGNMSNNSSFFSRQQPFSQQSQPYQRTQPQSNNKETTRGGGRESERSLNWRDQLSSSPSPPLSQQQAMAAKSDKKYPDPYRDRERDGRNAGAHRAEGAHPFSGMEFKRPPPKQYQKGEEERKGQYQKAKDDRMNGYPREERQESERSERNEPASSKWRGEQRRTNTVASRFNDRRGSRTDDYGNTQARPTSGRNQRTGGYEDDDDGSNDRVPEDPQPLPRLHGFGQGRRPDEKKDYGSKYGNQERKQQYGGQSSRNYKPEPQQEEDWGKTANAPIFISTEGGSISKPKKTGRTFVNSSFSFKGMHSDRMDNKHSSGSRDDDRDGTNAKQRGSRPNWD